MKFLNLMCVHIYFFHALIWLWFVLYWNKGIRIRILLLNPSTLFSGCTQYGCFFVASCLQSMIVIHLLFPVIVPTLIHLRLASFFLTAVAFSAVTHVNFSLYCFYCLVFLRPAGVRHQLSSFIRAWERLMYGLACPYSDIGYWFAMCNFNAAVYTLRNASEGIRIIRNVNTKTKQDMVWECGESETNPGIHRIAS